MLDARTVANRFLELSRKAGKPYDFTPMQLLKLVYIAHGWMLGLYGRPLIRDEVQAWQYGPVIPRLYNSIRHYRSRPVTEPITKGVPREHIDCEESDIIRQTHEMYGHLPGPALSRLTHMKGSPWSQVYEPGSFGIVIPNDIIEDYYFRRKQAAA